MLKVSRFALALTLAGATAGLAAQNDQDEPGDVAAAIRFQKAEDAAAARQARMDTARPAAKATAVTPRTKLDEPGDVAAAIRFQKAEDAAAARQARIEAARVSAELRANPQH